MRTRSGGRTSASMLLKVVPKNFAPDSSSSIISSCTEVMEATLSATFDTSSSTESSSDSGGGSADCSDWHAAPSSRTPTASMPATTGRNDDAHLIGVPPRSGSATRRRSRTERDP